MPAGMVRFAFSAALVIAFALGGLFFISNLSIPDTHLNYQIEFCDSLVPPASITEAQQCNYRPRDVLRNKLFSQSEKWVRVSVENRELPTRDLSILVLPHFIPELTLYAPSYESDSWQIDKTGSRVAETSTASILGGYIFVVTPTASANSVYYLHVRTYISGYFGVFVQPWPSSKVQNQLWLGSYVGILLLILIYASLSYLLDRGILMGRFALYLGAFLLSVLFGSGFFSINVLVGHPEVTDALFIASLCVRLITWIWLAQAFLEPYNPPIWYTRFCRGMIWCTAGSFFLFWTSLAVWLPAIVVIGQILVAAIQVWITIRNPNIDRSFRRVLILGYLLTPSRTILMIGSSLLSIPMDNLPIHLGRISDFIPPLVLLALVVFKSRQMRLELSSIRKELHETSLRAEFERNSLEERRMMIDMLTHELKNPLASISMAVGSLSQRFTQSDQPEQRRIRNIRQSISNIDAVIERVGLANALSQQSLPIIKHNIDLNELVKEAIESAVAPERITLQTPQAFGVHSDRRLLQIVLRNLIDNAINYSPLSTNVSVCIQPSTTTSVSITVSNHVDEEQIPDEKGLFTRFYRHPKSQEVSGSGLGLFLANEICQRLGGNIRYVKQSSSVQFIVELPI